MHCNRSLQSQNIGTFARVFGQGHQGYRVGMMLVLVKKRRKGFDDRGNSFGKLCIPILGMEENPGN